MKKNIPNELPEKFWKRLEVIVPKEKYQEVLKSFKHHQPTTFRANLLKISTSKLENELKKRSINFRKVEWYKDAFILDDMEQKTLTQTDLYEQGMLYIQSLSSMIPPLLLDPRPDEKVLDITAAPGSKTTQMAAMMKNLGEITANDKSTVRNYKLTANLKIQGVENTIITHFPGQIIWQKYPEYFAKTLVDVPCSMEGRINLYEEKSYEDWSTKKIRFLEGVQKYLLRSGVSATRPGGTIVYSTCTLAPEENEGVIDWILKREKGVVEVEEIKINIPEFSPALKVWNTIVYNEQVQKTKRVLPSTLMEGFYVAKLRKLKSNINKTSEDN